MKSIIQLAYQPIYDLRFNRIAHYEALTRIRHDDTNMGHRELIRLAERFRFVHMIDLAMMEMVCTDMDTHRDQVAINLSPLTISSSICKITKLMESSPDVKGRLLVEVTETIPMRDINVVRGFMTIARPNGVKVAFDDFGQQSGSFTADLVRDLKPDLLKLDGEVLERAAISGDTRELEYAANLVGQYGGELVAEHVDTEQKIAMLRSLGIRYAQGFAFGKPERRLLRELSTARPAVQDAA